MMQYFSRRNRQALVFIAPVYTLAFSSMSWAQSDDAPALEEVIVTAQKRAQTLQEIPAAVTPISGEFVEELLGSGENIRALAARVPSLQVESSNGRQSPRFYIRGLGNYDFDVNATQPVSMIYDNVVLENAVLKSIPLFDIEQVEVLQGPQGTLFGRGTTAGVVKIDSVKPSSDYNGYTSLAYGSRNTFNAQAAAGGALSNTVNARASFNYLSRDAWIDNTVINGVGDDFGGFDELAYRFQLSVEPTDDLSLLFKLHGFHQDGDQPQIFYANAFTPGTEGLRPGFDEEVVSHDAQSGFELDHIGASAQIEWGFDDMTFTSITSYDAIDSFSQADVDGGLQGGPEAIGSLGGQAFFSVASGDGLSDHSQLTQELRLSGEGGAVFYQVGLFLLDEDIVVDSQDFDNDGNSIALTQVEQQTNSAALFGQVEFSLTDSVSLTAGARYTDDSKDLEVIPGLGSTAPAATINADDDYFNWELALNYAMTDDFSVYARAATASRGPVTLGRFGFTSQADTENATSIETGFKSHFFDNRLRWNATIYSYEIEDQQLTATGGSGNTNELLNADKTLGSGFETDLEAVITDDFRVSFNLSYNKTEIDDSGLLVEQCSSNPLCTALDPVIETFDGPFGEVNLVSVDGNPLPRAPEWIANIKLDYELPFSFGSFYGSTDWNYRSDSNIFLYESVEFVAVDRWIGGARVGFKTPSRDTDIALVVRNITDEIVAEGALDFLNQTAFVNEPRYIGIEFKKSFD